MLMVNGIHTENMPLSLKKEAKKQQQIIQKNQMQ